MKALMYSLLTAFFVLVAGLYAGIGWSAARALDIGLNVDVNYSFFVWIGLGLYVLCMIPIAFFAGLTKMVNDKLENMDKIIQ